MLLFITVYSTGFAIVTALAAHSRNRAWLEWGMIGLVFGMFGLIAVLVMKDGEEEDIFAESVDTGIIRRIRCPQCYTINHHSGTLCTACGASLSN